MKLLFLLTLSLLLTVPAAAQISFTQGGQTITGDKTLDTSVSWPFDDDAFLDGFSTTQNWALGGAAVLTGETLDLPSAISVNPVGPGFAAAFTKGALHADATGGNAAIFADWSAAPNLELRADEDGPCPNNGPDLTTFSAAASNNYVGSSYIPFHLSALPGSGTHKLHGELIVQRLPIGNSANQAADFLFCGRYRILDSNGAVVASNAGGFVCANSLDTVFPTPVALTVDTKLPGGDYVLDIDWTADVSDSVVADCDDQIVFGGGKHEVAANGWLEIVGAGPGNGN